MGLWRDKERKEWCYSFEHLGKSYAGRGFKTKGEARKAREERRDQVKLQLSLDRQTHIDTVYDFKRIANEYLDEAKRRFAKKTYEYKAFVFKHFIAFCEETLNDEIPPINEIDSQLLHSYLITRPSNNNYNAHRKDLCALFTFAIRRLRIIKHNPFWDIEKMPHNPAPKRVPSQTDVLKLLMVAEPEEKPFLLTVILTLARVDEVNRLRWTDVNFEKRTVTKWTRKRKGGAFESVTIAMNKDLYDVLWRLWQNRTQEDWVFYNKDTDSKYNRRQKMMASLCKRAKIDPPFGFHALRHFIASLMADNPKVSKKTIGDMLGHKSLTTTEIYLHSIDESQRMALESIEGVFSDKKLVAVPGCGSGKNTRNQAEKAATTI